MLDKILAPGVFLRDSNSPSSGANGLAQFYVSKPFPTHSLYLSHEGKWEYTCSNGWFNTEEEAIAMFRRVSGSDTASELQWEEDRHWEDRQV